MSGEFPLDFYVAGFPITRAEEGEGGERAIYGLASNDALDRMGTTVDQESLGRAARRYLKRNGKIFYNHSWTVPIGRATEVNVRDNGLFVRATIGSGFSVPVNTSMFGATTLPVDDIWSMIRQGLLTSYSVGFDGGPDPEDKKGQRILVKDLFEVSVTAIPGNPDAEFAVTRALDSFPFSFRDLIARREQGLWLLDDPAKAPEEEEEGQSGDFAAVMEELKRCRKNK